MQDLEGMSHEQAAERMRGAFQAVLTELPPGAAVLMTQQAFIPGCILMLVDMAAAPQEEGEGSDGEEVLDGGDQQGEDSGGEGEALHEVAELQQQQQQGLVGVEQVQQQVQQQQQRPALVQGFWRVPISSSSARNALMFLAYASLSDFEARVNDGTLVQALAAFLPNEGGPSGGAAAGAEATHIGSDPVVVASQGGQLQVLLELPQHTSVSQSSPSSSSTISSAIRVVLVQGQRALLDQVYEVEQLRNFMPLRLPLPCGRSSGSIAVSGSLTDSAAVMALYVLPAAANARSAFHGPSSTSSSTAVTTSSGMSSGDSIGIGSSSDAGRNGVSSWSGAAPLAHLTLLQLPPSAVAELCFWVEQQGLSHELLQPLFEDMAVAVEAATAAAASGGLCMGNAAAVWSQAAGTCQRARSVLEAYELGECADLMAICLQRVLLMQHRAQPLAAGALPAPEIAPAAESRAQATAADCTAAAAVAAGMIGPAAAAGRVEVDAAADSSASPADAAGVAAAAAANQDGPLTTDESCGKVQMSAEASTGMAAAVASQLEAKQSSAVAAAISTAAGEAENAVAAAAAAAADDEVIGPSKLCEALAAPAAKLKGAKDLHPDEKDVSSKQGVPAGSSSSRHSSTATASSGNAVAAAGWQLWVFRFGCVAGALFGWSDRAVEAAYQASRLQRRPPTWIMMGCLDVFANLLTGGRVLFYALEMWARGGAWGWALCYMSVLAVTFAYGLWLLFCPKASWPRMGMIAIVHDLAVCLPLLAMVVVAGPSALGDILPGAFRKAQPSLAAITGLFGAVRIVLHQLPPPWLLRHAAFPAFKVWAIYSYSPELWSVAPGIPVCLQIGGICAAAVAVVVVQEAISRAKYIRAVTTRHASSSESTSAGCVDPRRME